MIYKNFVLFFSLTEMAPEDRERHKGLTFIDHLLCAKHIWCLVESSEYHCILSGVNPFLQMRTLKPRKDQ